MIDMHMHSRLQRGRRMYTVRIRGTMCAKGSLLTFIIFTLIN